MLSPPRNRGFRSCPFRGFAGIPSEALLGSLGKLSFDPGGGLAGVLRRGEALYPEGGIVGLPSGNGMSGLGRVRYLCALLRSVSPACVLH